MDTLTLIPLIEAAMDLTRRNPKAGEPVPSDGYYAWVILNELRRAGFDVVRTNAPPP